MSQPHFSISNHSAFKRLSTRMLYLTVLVGCVTASSWAHAPRYETFQAHYTQPSPTVSDMSYTLLAQNTPFETANTPELEQAHALFEQYIQLEEAFNPDIALLYADTALIQVTKKRPDGGEETLHIPPQRYKTILKTMMPMAEALNDSGTYHDIEYTQQANGQVRIESIRYSKRSQRKIPLVLIVGPDNYGDWVIFEESSRVGF